MIPARRTVNRRASGKEGEMDRFAALFVIVWLAVAAATMTLAFKLVMALVAWLGRH